MTPLDLTQRPPRHPDERLGGVVFLARTVDKLRAQLPGGNLGDYRITGMTTAICEQLGLSIDELRMQVQSAQDEAQVAQWIEEHSTADGRSAVNDRYSALTIAERANESPGFFERNPWARMYPAQMRLFDALAADDAAHGDVRAN